MRFKWTSATPVLFHRAQLEVKTSAECHEQWLDRRYEACELIS